MVDINHQLYGVTREQILEAAKSTPPTPVAPPAQDLSKIDDVSAGVIEAVRPVNSTVPPIPDVPPDEE